MNSTQMNDAWLKCQSVRLLLNIVYAWQSFNQVIYYRYHLWYKKCLYSAAYVYSYSDNMIWLIFANMTNHSKVNFKTKFLYI